MRVLRAGATVSATGSGNHRSAKSPIPLSTASQQRLNGHGGVVTADAADRSPTSCTRATDEDPRQFGLGTPPADLGIGLRPGPRQVAVEDVAAGHGEVGLQVVRRVDLDAGRTV